jgi:hypothetical protein
MMLIEIKFTQQLLVMTPIPLESEFNPCSPVFKRYKQHRSCYVSLGGKVHLSNLITSNEELHNLYSSRSIIKKTDSKRMRWAGHVARMTEKRNAYRILMVKTRRKETARKTKK